MVENSPAEVVLASGMRRRAHGEEEQWFKGEENPAFM